MVMPVSRWARASSSPVQTTGAATITGTRKRWTATATGQTNTRQIEGEIERHRQPAEAGGPMRQPQPVERRQPEDQSHQPQRAVGPAAPPAGRRRQQPGRRRPNHQLRHPEPFDTSTRSLPPPPPCRRQTTPPRRSAARPAGAASADRSPAAAASGLAPAAPTTPARSRPAAKAPAAAAPPTTAAAHARPSRRWNETRMKRSKDEGSRRERWSLRRLFGPVILHPSSFILEDVTARNRSRMVVPQPVRKLSG